MKTILYVVAGLFASACVVSCGLVTDNSRGNDSDSLVLDSIQLEDFTFMTESHTFKDSLEQNGVTAFYELMLDIPVSGSTPLLISLTNWIDSLLGGNYEGKKDFSEDMLKSYASLYFQHCDEQGIFDAGPAAAYSLSAIVTADTDMYVSYEVQTSEYQGGAKPLPGFFGATFDKETGERLGWNLFADSTDLAPLFKKHLLAYFGDDVTEKNLPDYLYEDIIRHFPLPTAVPWLTEEGVKFAYGAYEIAPGAAGMPTGVIPVKSVEKFLSDKAKKLVRGKK